MNPFLFKFKNLYTLKIPNRRISFDSSIDMLIVNSGNENKLLINDDTLSLGTKKESNERGGGEDQKADLL